MDLPIAGCSAPAPPNWKPRASAVAPGRLAESTSNRHFGTGPTCLHSARQEARRPPYPGGMAVPPLLVPVRQLLHAVGSAQDATWTPQMSALFAECAEQARLYLSEVSLRVQSAWQELDAFVAEQRFVTNNGAFDRELVERLSRYNAFASLELCPVDPAVSERLEGKPWLGFSFGDS